MLEIKPGDSCEALRTMTGIFQVIIQCLYVFMIRDSGGGGLRGEASRTTADTNLDFKVRSKVIMVPWLQTPEENIAHKVVSDSKNEILAVKNHI